MNGLLSLDSTICLHSALALLHFLWQGLLLATIACLAAWCLHSRSAAARYGVHAATLLLMLACLPATFTFLHWQDVAPTPDLAFAAPLPSAPAVMMPPLDDYSDMPIAPPNTPVVSNDSAISPALLPAYEPAPPIPEAMAPVIAHTEPVPITERLTRWTIAIYLVGVCLMFTRMLLGFSGTRRLRRNTQPLTDPEFLEMVRRRAREFSLRRVPVVAYCNRLAVPALVGLWRPMILLPTVLATGLTPEQLELVIVHEMAHIRRWDNAWLVVQRVVESILFFHPAVWYVSRRMSIERELCCDAMVVDRASRRSDYAESLLRVVELTTEKQVAIPATATMTSRREGSAILVQRLMRILGEPKSSPVRLPQLWPTVIMAFLIVTAVCLVRLNVYGEPPDAATAERADEESSKEKGSTDAAPEATEGDGLLSGLIEALPGGGYIKLVAVSEYPETERPAWSVDGESMGQPLPAPDHESKMSVHLSRYQMARRFRFQVLSTKDLKLECWSRGNLYAPDPSCELQLKGQSEPQTWDVVFTMWGTQKTIDLFVDASEVWQPFTVWDRAKEPLAVEGESGTDLHWKVDRTVLARRQFRVVLANFQGPEIAVPAEEGASLGHQVPLTFHFPTLSLDEVRDYRLESRLHTTAGFRAVSLESGNRSKAATGVSLEEIRSAQSSIPRIKKQMRERYPRVDDPQRSRYLSGIQRARQIASFYEPRDRRPFTEYIAAKDVSPEEKTLAKLIARHELYKVHAEAREDKDPAAKQQAALLATRLMEPLDVGVKWYSDVYNPDNKNRPPVGPIEEMLLAEMPAGENEIFYRSDSSLRYLMRVPMDRDCLTCHVSRRGVFDDRNVPPNDRLDVGDVLAAIRVEIMPKWAVLANFNLEGAFPKDGARSELVEGTVAPSGQCHDGNGNAIAGAELTLYHLDWSTRTQSVVERTKTDDRGRFRFSQVAVSLERIEEYGVIATFDGRTTAFQRFPYRSFWGEQIEKIDLSMEKASELRGRVTGPEGEPVQGAMVWARRPLPQPVVGLQCAFTDANGRFVIEDLAPLDRESLSQPAVSAGGEKVFNLTPGERLYCRHPAFAYTWQLYQEIPSEVDFNLAPAAAIEGRLVYAESGEPAAKVGVGIQSIKEGDYQQVVTDEQGRYRFTSLRGEKYNIWPVMTQWTAPAVDSFEAFAGETCKAPDLKLVRGATISGRLVHGVTGRPLSLAEFCTPIDKNTFPFLAVKSPDRPKSGSGQHGVRFRKDGSYEVRVPPGESKLTFQPPKGWKMVNLSLGVERTFSLVDGQEKRLDLWVVVDRNARGLPSPSPPSRSVPSRR